jgi:small subunit ribosomal protein S23
MEAVHLGAVFGRGEIAYAFEKEKRALATFERREELDEGAMAARKRWKAIVEKQPGGREWTQGQEYVRLWKEGVRPNYAPQLTQPVVAALTPEEVAESADYMQALPVAR